MKFRAFILFFLLLGLLPDFYLCAVLLRDAPLVWKICVCLPTLGTLVSLPLIGLGIRYTDAVNVFSYLTFIFEGPKFFGCLFTAIWNFPHRYRYAMGEPFHIDPVPPEGITQDWLSGQASKVRDKVAALEPLVSGR
jgi:hypothetical protein